MNPLFAMPQVSGKPAGNNVATFSPVVLTNYTIDIEKMNALINAVYDDALLQDIATFRDAVKVNNIQLAFATIVRIYPYKISLMKTFLETAIDYIPVTKISTINTVFAMTDIDMEPEEVVALIKLLCSKAYRHAKMYTFTTDTQQSINDMIIAANDKCNFTYEKLRYCDPKYWSFPLYLRMYAEEGAGLQFKFVPDATLKDISMARKLAKLSR